MRVIMTTDFKQGSLTSNKISEFYIAQQIASKPMYIFALTTVMIRLVIYYL